MDWWHSRYSALRNDIEERFNTFRDWKEVHLFYESMGIQVLRGFFYLDDEFTMDNLNTVLQEMKSYLKDFKVKKIGRDIKSDAQIPVDKRSTWKLYEDSLIKKAWSISSIKKVEQTSYQILQYLSMDTQEDGSVKGLVVGNVQSGKTANMAGLMAMAADNGFNYFIILSGVIEKLREQTAARLYNDMKYSGTSNLNWNQVDNPSILSKAPEHDISKYNLNSDSRERYFTVCLKNSKRLNDLINWIFSDVKKSADLKVLVIDDEADQASINTKNIESENQTAINRLIRRLVNTNKVKGMNYIAYTATPYANILNETTEGTLYPNDFIVLLDSSEDYIGPTEIFGTENPETSPSVDIVREVSEADKKIVQRIQEEVRNEVLPKGLVDSIHWFILTVASMRALDYDKPISMLVHTSFKIAHHQAIAKKIDSYLIYFKENHADILPRLKQMYLNESLDFKRSIFLKAMPYYSTPENVPHYPAWEDVLPYIQRVINLEDEEFVSHIPIGEEGEPKFHRGFHLAIDNSQSKAEDQIIRLVYPRDNQMPNPAPAFIVVGGNTLSRGLTLEGLTTTFFLRTTSQADTLMQMARWFGFRKGYEIFPRIWLDRQALERFQFLSQMNEEMRDEMEGMAERGQTPIDYAPRIKNSPNYQLIRITSKNKMQSARSTEFDFRGFNTQTIYFEKNKKKLMHNLKCTSEFLNKLNEPELNRNHMVWRDVHLSDVKSFLTKYKVCDSDIKMSSIPALIEWIEKNDSNLANWSVILSSKGYINKTQIGNSDWNIQGYYPKSVMRTRLKNRSTDEIVNIGALRGPSDLFADIDADLTMEEKKVAKPHRVQRIRNKYGYGKTPQLLIYRIDNGNISEEEFRRKNVNSKGEPIRTTRSPINFPLDIIGINIMIPGETKGNLATYIAAEIQVNDDVDEALYIDDEGNEAEWN